MWDSVSELLSSKPGAPSVEFKDAISLGLVGHKVSLGAVQRLLMRRYNNCAVAIGVAVGSTIDIPLTRGSVITWTRAHRVICILRRYDYYNAKHVNPPALSPMVPRVCPVVPESTPGDIGFDSEFKASGIKSPNSTSGRPLGSAL